MSFDSHTQEEKIENTNEQYETIRNGKSLDALRWPQCVCVCVYVCVCVINIHVTVNQT